MGVHLDHYKYCNRAQLITIMKNPGLKPKLIETKESMRRRIKEKCKEQEPIVDNALQEKINKMRYMFKRNFIDDNQELILEARNDIKRSLFEEFVKSNFDLNVIKRFLDGRRGRNNE